MWQNFWITNEQKVVLLKYFQGSDIFTIQPMYLTFEKSLCCANLFATSRSLINSLPAIPVMRHAWNFRHVSTTL